MLLPSVGGIPKFAVSIICYFVLFFVFVGPIEELVFRGYIQSRLNEAFDRPYRFFGISWGSGLIITSLLFAFVHVTNYNFNPLIGHYSLDWGWGLGVFITGAGFVLHTRKDRKHSGSGNCAWRGGLCIEYYKLYMNKTEKSRRRDLNP